jgi:hypothetical protein
MLALLAGDDAEAVVLDLVQPAGPDGGHSQGDGRQGSIRRVRGNMGWGRCSVPYRIPRAHQEAAGAVSGTLARRVRKLSNVARGVAKA